MISYVYQMLYVNIVGDLRKDRGPVSPRKVHILAVPQALLMIDSEAIVLSEYTTVL